MSKSLVTSKVLNLEVLFNLLSYLKEDNQSADIMSSLYSVGAHVRMNNFSKTTRSRDMLFF